MRRRLAEADEFLAEFPDPVDQLQLIVYQLMLAERDDRAATVAFAREIVRFASEDVMSDVRAMRTRYSQMVADIIRRGVEQGSFAQIDPSLAALQLFGMCNWSWTWFEPDGAWSAREIADDFCRTLIGGFSRQGLPDDLRGEALAQTVIEAMRAHRADEPAAASGDRAA
ncbi:MAG: TetR/AcrR family transcriptional regulator, cholesterol catabolism regulator [Solirubrobacterales bacterium]|nr:TetR/AcrR family transcriptional regulator, cholesterol catabolism regulator [Solirubrobacterales bacterium]